MNTVCTVLRSFVTILESDATFYMLIVTLVVFLLADRLLLDTLQDHQMILRLHRMELDHIKRQILVLSNPTSGKNKEI